MAARLAADASTTDRVPRAMNNEHEHHRRLTEIFGEAVERPEVERDAYLARACRGDAALEGEVRHLLRHDRPLENLQLVAVPPAPETDRAGEIVGRFRIVEPAGKGGMGIVWKAVDGALGRVVAVKFLPQALLDSEVARRRFLREARAAADLSHACIATVYDVGETDGVPYIAMQFVAGNTVRDRVHDAGFSPFDAVRVAACVADALAHAHGRGVLHRDIKPSNIMIQPDGAPVVLDFGVARRTTDTSRLSKTGELIGTIGYMAPEVMKGEDATALSDIYSLGVVLYEMLTGRRPFDDRRVQTFIRATLTLDPELPGRFTAGIPRELDKIVARTLRRPPQERHPDARTLADELGALLASGRLGSAPSHPRRKWWFGFRP